MNPELFKRWKISETLLKRAHAALPRAGKEDARFSALEGAFNKYLDHSEYELALNVLEELGNMTAPRGGFWKDLMRAAENMALANRIPRFQEEFDKALVRPNQESRP